MRNFDKYARSFRSLDRAAAPFVAGGHGGAAEPIWSPRILPVALRSTTVVRMSLRGCGSPRCRIFVRSLDLDLRDTADW
jgi:hypothetical protein